jgi:hypothetical protein
LGGGFTTESEIWNEAEAGGGRETETETADGVVH